MQARLTAMQRLSCAAAIYKCCGPQQEHLCTDPQHSRPRLWTIYKCVTRLRQGHGLHMQGWCAESQGGIYLGAILDCIRSDCPSTSSTFSPKPCKIEVGMRRTTRIDCHAASPPATLGCSDAQPCVGLEACLHESHSTKQSSRQKNECGPVQYAHDPSRVSWTRGWRQMQLQAYMAWTPSRHLGIRHALQACRLYVVKVFKNTRSSGTRKSLFSTSSGRLMRYA